MKQRNFKRGSCRCSSSKTDIHEKFIITKRKKKCTTFNLEFLTADVREALVKTKKNLKAFILPPHPAKKVLAHR